MTTLAFPSLLEGVLPIPFAAKPKSNDFLTHFHIMLNTVTKGRVGSRKAEGGGTGDNQLIDSRWRQTQSSAWSFEGMAKINEPSTQP